MSMSADNWWIQGKAIHNHAIPNRKYDSSKIQFNKSQHSQASPWHSTLMDSGSFTVFPLLCDTIPPQNNINSTFWLENSVPTLESKLDFPSAYSKYVTGFGIGMWHVSVQNQNFLYFWEIWTKWQQIFQFEVTSREDMLEKEHLINANSRKNHDNEQVTLTKDRSTKHYWGKVY